MTQKKFNPMEWRPDAALTLRDEVETVTSRIEAAGIDIAPAYDDWLNLGFALAEGLGEEGRAFYHRLSRFYAGYRREEAEKQYDACLRSRGKGVTVNTFFHLARTAGIDIRIASPAPGNRPTATKRQNDTATTGKRVAKRSPSAEVPPKEVPSEEAVLPLFPAGVYASLPALLKEVCSHALSDADRGMLLLGSLTVLSSCLTQVSGVYGQRLVYPNLYLFVSARASAGKGRLTLCRHLVDVVHADLRRRNRAEWEEYRRASALYNQKKRKEAAEEPVPPPVRMLLIPANSTSTALFQTLNDNEGQALMFETEGDTLTTTFRSEHGNYSDGLRKAFHHEPIAYNRRKDREYVEISAPRLSVLLSGTPRQIGALIPDAENGLFSRFLFYHLPLSPVWNDVFASVEGDTLDSRFLALGGRFFRFYTRLRHAGALTFALSEEQQQAFNRFFAGLQQRGLEEKGPDMLPSVRRLGLNTYRICMVLSALRLMDYEGDAPLPGLLGCRDDDFHTALALAEVLLAHTEAAYDSLCADAATSQQPPAADSALRKAKRCQAFYDALPDRFNHHELSVVAAAEGISVRTAERYVGELCRSGKLVRAGFADYEKPDATCIVPESEIIVDS